MGHYDFEREEELTEEFMEAKRKQFRDMMEEYNQGHKPVFDTRGLVDGSINPRNTDEYMKEWLVTPINNGEQLDLGIGDWDGTFNNPLEEDKPELPLEVYNDEPIDGEKAMEEIRKIVGG